MTGYLSTTVVERRIWLPIACAVLSLGIIFLNFGQLWSLLPTPFGSQPTSSITAFSLLLLSLTLILFGFGVRGRWTYAVPSLVLLFNLVLLPAEDIFGLVLPSPTTLWKNSALALAILLMNHPRVAVRHLGEYLAGLSAILALTSLLAAVMGIDRVEGPVPFVTPSSLGAALVFALSFSCLQLMPSGAAIQLLRDADVAGRLLRALILLTLGALVLIALFANPELGPHLFSNNSELLLVYSALFGLMLMAIFSLGHLFRIETLESGSFERQLNESAQYLQSVLDIAPVGILTIDDRGVIRSANRAAREIFGFDRGGLISMNVEALVPVGVRASHRAFREHYLEAPTTREMGASRELQAIKADGTPINVEIFLSPLKLKGQPMVVVSVNDITERTRLTQELLSARDALQVTVEERTQELQQSYEQLLQRNSELQQFSYAASHDLQTPLRGIGVYAGALMEDYGTQLDQQARAYLDFIVAEAQRLQSLINNLLDYAHIDQQNIGARTEVDLNLIVDEVVQALHHAMHESQTFQVERGELPIVRGNRTLLVQLFYNLIENAIKYRSAEREPLVQVRAEQARGMAVIRVADNGIGIESEHFQRIFQVFRRLHTAREYPGTGIGLAICKRIVERHNGSIEVESIPGIGTVFCIRIPIEGTHLEGDEQDVDER